MLLAWYHTLRTRASNNLFYAMAEPPATLVIRCHGRSTTSDLQIPFIRFYHSDPWASEMESVQSAMNQISLGFFSPHLQVCSSS